MNKNKMRDQFQKDTKNHSMEILRDDELYRHLKFTNNGSNIYRFDLVTWPGYLAVTGDMGEFIFSRIPDMFQFFRDDKGEINPGYWAEKCLAADKHGGIKEFSEDKARENVKDFLESHYDGDQEKLNAALEKADEEINYSEGEVRFYDSCVDFETPEGKEVFFAGEIPGCLEYTHRFIWVLYAIVWGISQYDLKK